MAAPPPTPPPPDQITGADATIARLTQELLKLWLVAVQQPRRSPSAAPQPAGWSPKATHTPAQNPPGTPVPTVSEDWEAAVQRDILQLLSLCRFGHRFGHRVGPKTDSPNPTDPPAPVPNLGAALETLKLATPPLEAAQFNSLSEDPWSNPLDDRTWGWLRASGQAFAPQLYPWAKGSRRLLPGYWVQVIGEQVLSKPALHQSARHQSALHQSAPHQSALGQPELDPQNLGEQAPHQPALPLEPLAVEGLEDQPQLPPAFAYVWDPQINCVTQGQWLTSPRSRSQHYQDFIHSTQATPSSPSPCLPLPNTPLWVLSQTLTSWEELFKSVGSTSIGSTSIGNTALWIAPEPSGDEAQALEPLCPLQNFSRDSLWEQRIRLPEATGSGLILRRIVTQIYGTSEADRRVILTNATPHQVSAHQAVQLIELAHRPPALLTTLGRRLGSAPETPLQDLPAQNLPAQTTQPQTDRPVTPGADHATDHPAAHPSAPNATAQSPLCLALVLALVSHNLLETVKGLIYGAGSVPTFAATPSTSWQRLLYNSRLSRVARRYILKKLPTNSRSGWTPPASANLYQTLHQNWVIEAMQTLITPENTPEITPNPFSPGDLLPSESIAPAWQHELEPILKTIAQRSPLPTQPQSQDDWQAMPTWYRVQVETNLHALAILFQNLDPARHHCPGETLWPQCKLALAEGFSNAVRYAHQGYPLVTPLDLEMAVTQRGLELRLWDYGSPFSIWDTLGQRGLSLRQNYGSWMSWAWQLERFLDQLRQTFGQLFTDRLKQWLKKLLPLAVGGRGLSLMQETVDYLDYIALENGRNCLVLIKYFPDEEN
ncbi:MAG: ATP-binding protein [Prochlorothrix sp.]